jgi:S-adenosylmethionine:tRNA ribosyltransferase-isomerase
MVSYRSDDRIINSRFTHLPDFLVAGDVLVINTSGTLNAALAVTLASDGTPYELHLSTRLPNDQWIVEVRLPGGETTKPFYDAETGWKLHLPDGAIATLIAPASLHAGLPHLWTAELILPAPPVDYLAEHGFPIRYSYVKQSWPGSAYQTVYATEMGSAEMPSAGRAFSQPLLAKLEAMGVHIAPLILHTGVASLDDDELPHEEYFRVPEATAQIVNAARAEGRRIIAVGTTVVRALETVTGPDGIVQAGEGWTRLIVTPQTGMHVVDGLITGLHEPESTHIAILRALASEEHLRAAYSEALVERYLWHEFGDLHLILPG